MTSQLELLVRIKEAEEGMQDKTPDYRLGYLQGARFVLDYLKHRHDGPMTHGEPNPGAVGGR